MIIDISVGWVCVCVCVWGGGGGGGGVIMHTWRENHAIKMATKDSSSQHFTAIGLFFNGFLIQFMMQLMYRVTPIESDQTHFTFDLCASILVSIANTVSSRCQVWNLQCMNHTRILDRSKYY